MGVMEISTPTLKNNIPIMSKIAPIRNVIKILGGMGAIVKHRSNTIARIGRTAFSVSDSFSLNFERLKNNYIKRLSFLSFESV
jgi:hypothetical protein